MSQPDIESRFLSEYDHRDSSTVETVLDAERILEGYAEQRNLANHHPIDAEMPYHAALGRAGVTDDSELLSILHYLQPVDEGTQHRAIGRYKSTGDIEEEIKRRIPEARTLGCAGIETETREPVDSPSGERIYPESVHCMVFYDDPFMDPIELKHRVDFEGPVHRKVALEAVSNDSLGTAIVVSGDEKSALQVDYWPRPIDTQIQDYGEINWNDPTEAI